MTRQPVGLHGVLHSPLAQDPVFTEVWHKSGTDGEPAFQNSWDGLLWFRLCLGSPRTIDTVSGITPVYSITPVVRQQLEVILKVDGGTPGSTIITLPLGWYDWADNEQVPGNGQDTAGNFRAYYIDGVTGDIVDGPAP